ncbi:cholesterol 25-hydroxylase-like isoform X2 [Adelges cooleyi]|nr:cholesterol 25-hydroxylase-like isoform X2 [Adelges cooleyi]
MIANVLALFSLFFIVPIHWVPYTTIQSYNLYHTIQQHSGIDFKPSWWQLWRADVMYHDAHHMIGRVNFSLSCHVWDKIHGTMHESNRNQSSKKSKDPSIIGRSSANK